MRNNYWKWMASVSGLTLALAILPSAGAQCGLPLKALKPMSWQARSGVVNLKEASFAKDDEDDAASIVGMWHVSFTAKTLNGAPIPDTQIDNSLVVWHSDKTEIMNSGRPPQDGNFCLGVWEQTAKFHYKLNHFAWSANNFTPGTAEGIVGAPIGPVHYIEEITLSPDGKRYSGTFTLQQYDTTGQVAISFSGVLKATRITVNTTVPDLL